MIKEILNKIENKRDSAKPIWQFLVFIKDRTWSFKQWCKKNIEYVLINALYYILIIFSAKIRFRLVGGIFNLNSRVRYLYIQTIFEKLRGKDLIFVQIGANVFKLERRFD
jgi:hypothetical protein